MTLNEVLDLGGVCKINGVSVFVDNPDNLNEYSTPTGFYIINASGWKVYFKTRSRKVAQETCNEVYGKGKYTVRDKV